MHAFIEDYLNDYIASERPDFAVMLTGEWGSGKTYWVEDYIERNLKIKDGKSSAVYVSLNGISGVNRITAAILGSMNRFLRSRLFKGAIACGTAAVSALSNASKDDVLGLFDSGLALLKVNAKLVVLDDLERCALPLDEVLGYVANLLHDGVHVLLVGSEGELRNKHKNYDKIKEKIIGRTFRIPENIDVVYDSIVGDISYKQIQSVLSRLRDKLIHDFKSVPNACNYRAFKHAIRDCAYWYRHFSRKIQKNETFINDFSQRFIALAYETQLGNLKKEIFGERKNPFDEKEPPTEFDMILERHGITLMSFIDTCPYLILSEETVARMLFSERITFDAINKEILESSYFLEPDKKTEWQRLMDWDTCEDAEVTQLIKIVHGKLEKYEYTIPEEILHVYCLLCHLSEYGVIPNTPKTIVSQAKKYIVTLRRRGLLQQMQTTGGPMAFGRSWGGYSYHGEFEGRPWYVSIRDELIRQTSESENDKIRDWIAANCPGGIDGGSSEFVRRVANGGEWADRPVFQYVDPDRFLSSFNALTNRDKRRLGEILNCRYYNCQQGLKERESKFWGVLAKRLAGIVVPRKRKAARCPSVLQFDILYNLINDNWGLGLPKAKIRMV